MNIVSAIFLVLHGLVHLLYFGQGMQFFKLQPGMTWPANSWLFTRIMDEGAARIAAGSSCVIAFILFAAGATGIVTEQSWWRPVGVAAAIFSSVIFLLFWDGKNQALANQGLFAILINVAVLVAVLAVKWPDFGF